MEEKNEIGTDEEAKHGAEGNSPPARHLPLPKESLRGSRLARSLSAHVQASKSAADKQKLALLEKSISVAAFAD